MKKANEAQSILKETIYTLLEKNEVGALLDKPFEELVEQ